MDFAYQGVIDRHPSDFYSTPEWATQAMLDVVEFKGRIWEPACGDGAIARILPGDVAATDLYDRGYGSHGVNFLISDLKEPCQNVVTNPPFRLAEQFVRHSLEVTTAKVALFLRLQFLESQRRYKLFAETPLSRVLVFSKRVSCGRSGEEMTGGKVAYAWFIWEHGYVEAPVLEWLL